MKINSSGSSAEEMEYNESCAQFSINSENIQVSPDKSFNQIKNQNHNSFEGISKVSNAEEVTCIAGSSKSNKRYSKKKTKMSDDQSNIRAMAAEKRLQKSNSKNSPMNKVRKQRPVVSPMDDCSDSGNEAVSWAGSPLSVFSRLRPSNLNIPPIDKSSSDHEIYVRLPLNSGEMPCPYPDTYQDMWDSEHVRMPNSNESLNLIKLPNGKSKLAKRWPMINDALKREINSVRELHQAILSYNARYESRWRFDGLKYLLEEEFTVDEQNFFFQKLLPKIIDLALNLPNIVTRPPILLSQKCTRSISLSQKQISCLLANAFLCTFPRRNARGNTTEYAKYPDINFNRLFFHKDESALEKMKCIINYFREVFNREPDGIITFTRQYIPASDMPKFEQCNKPLPKLHADSKGFIEETPGLLQVDFANKYIGGGVLGLGCVQEEIRFVLCPELLVSMLFTEVLNKHEALIVTGVEQYSKSKGYASSFEWTGTFHDVTLRDQYKRRLCQVVGIDALHFSRNPSIQYKPELVMREIEKAYAGFCVLDGSLGTPTGIASGNWGCGAFRGDPKLKSLIQIAAAGAAGRDLAYFTFGDRKLRDNIVEMHRFLTDNSVTVGELVMVLCHYGLARKDVCGKDLYVYIRHNIKGYNSDTDSGSGNSKRDEQAELSSSNSCYGSERESTEKSLELQKKVSEPIRPKPFEETQLPLPENLEQKKVTKPKQITDYFKKAPQGGDVIIENSATRKEISEDLATISRPNPIFQETLTQVLKECDKLRNKSVDNGASASVSKYFDCKTSMSCEDNEFNSCSSKDDSDSTMGLLDRLNKFDNKL